MTPHSKKVQDSKRELDRLETAIRDMKIEWDKYFNGALDLPPEESRFQVQRRIRALRRRRQRAFADRFRLNSLEIRFNVLSELLNRRLREVERSPQRRGRRGPSARPALDPRSGIDLASTKNLQAVEKLYAELYQSSGRSKKIDFDTFQKYLGSQIEKVRAKTGCDKVQFRVAEEGNQLKLKAKPIRHSEPVRSRSS